MQIRCMIIAIGNAGGNICETIIKENNNSDLRNACFVYVDCNENDLQRHESAFDKVIPLDSVNEDTKFNLFEGVDKLIIVTGLGGKFSTEVIESVAKSAVNAGVETVKVVATLPFSFEGEKRFARALEVANRLSEIPDIDLTIYNNNDLLERYSNLNFLNAFEAADKEIIQVIEMI